MTKKIFRSFMVSAAAVLLAAVAIVMTCLYSYFASVQENQLQDQLQLSADSSPATMSGAERS